MDKSSEEPEINAEAPDPEVIRPLEAVVMSTPTDSTSEVVTEIITETIITTTDPSTSAATVVAETSSEITKILEEPVSAIISEQPIILIPEQQPMVATAAEITPEQRIFESIETVAANISEKPIETVISPEQKIAESLETTAAASSTDLPSSSEATLLPEQKAAEMVEAPIVAPSSSKIPAPPNPKSHPALPRPPSQTSQRPVFHIIAPRSLAPDSTTRIYRPRQYVAKSSTDIRPNIVRPYEPRRYIRIDKPPMAIQRPRKTAPSVVNILQSAATSKIPIRTTTHKPVNIHQLQPGPSTSKQPPKPATSAPPPTGPITTLLKPPKSVTPQPSTSVGRPRKVKQHISQRTSEEPLEKRRKPSVDNIGEVPEGDENEKGEEDTSSSEQDPNRSARQRDAVDYLEEVKRKFDTKTYNNFLEVMKGFKMKNMDTLGVIRQICYLFSTDTSLIDGFNNFLPQGYDISHDGRYVRIRDPQGQIHNVDIMQNPEISSDFPIGEEGPSTSAPTVLPPQLQPFITPSQFLPSHPQLQQPQQQQPQQQQLFLHPQLLQQQLPQQQELSRENAVSFLQGLRERIPPEKYEKFLIIIKENEKMDLEGTALMFQKVAHLFESDENLLLGFSDFLPDIKHWCHLEHIKRQICENTILNKDYYQDLELKFRKYSTEGKFASEPSASASSAATAAVNEGEGDNDEIQLTNYIPLRTKPINNLIHIVKSAMTDEYVFFNKLREAIDDDKIFDNFVRCLRLYTNSLISRDELFSITIPFFRGLPLLQREFKRIMGYSEYIQYPIPNHEIVGQGGVDLHMKSELDFTTLKCNGRSYRLLPEKYRHPKCSGRTVLCREVLNDNWAIFPSWQSEETTRVSIKKSSFEEFLHRTEDERFEIDILIQVNTEAMTALERIRRLASMDPRFEVGENYECGSKTFMIRAIRRAYGEHGARVLEALKKNPLLVATTVLNRLKIKQREWKNMENAFKLVWEDQARKYYQKMTDMRIAKVKRSDNKKLKGSYVFSVVQKLFKQRHIESLRGELEKEQKIHGSNLYLSFPINWRVAYDLQDLLLKFIKRQQSINQDEKQSMKQFIHKVLPMFFDLIPYQNEDDAIAAKVAGGEEENGKSSIKVKIPVPRKPALQPRTFYCGDDFLHFIYLYQVVVIRLHKLLVRSQEYIKEEEHKFEILKMRQKAFKEAEAKLPEWCDNQWDVINGWDAIIPDKRRSSDRYLTFISDIISLIEGKMPSNTFDECIKSLFESDAYPVLGLDKFIATMVKLLQTMVQDDKMLTMINKYWPYNYLTEDVNVERVFAECLEALPRLFNHQNAYQIQIYDQKQTILGIKMVIFASPYISYSKKFKSQEWKVYRRTYRNDANQIQREKEKPSRYKSKPLFLMRNLKKGYERLGRLTQQDELYESSTSEESSSEEEGEKKSKKSNSESEYDEEEDESDFEVPYKGQPGLLRRDLSTADEEAESDIEMDTDFDGLEKALSSDKKMIVVDRGCQTYESEFEGDEEPSIKQLKRMVELAEKEMRGTESGNEIGEDNDEGGGGEEAEDETSEATEMEVEEEEEESEEDFDEEEDDDEDVEEEEEIMEADKSVTTTKSLTIEFPEESEREDGSDVDDEEEEGSTNESEEDEEEIKKAVEKELKKNERKRRMQKRKTFETLKEEDEEKESDSSESSEKSPPPFIPQEPLLLPPGSSKTQIPQIPKLSPKQATRSPSVNIISQDECRRRINKLTAHQSYKMLKAEFRSARIPPISDTEHDYDDPEIDEFGGLHPGGTDEDRIWWTEKLKLKKDKKTKKQQQIDLDSSSDEDEEEYSRPQRKQSRRPPPIRKPRKKPGPKKGWKKQAPKSPASATSGGPSRKKSTSTETIEKQNPISEEEKEEEGVEIRLPAPPRRYSTSDDNEDDEIEIARGDRGVYDGRESPKLDFGDNVDLISDSEVAAAREGERERSTSKVSEASTKPQSKSESRADTPKDFIRTTRSRSRSMSKASSQLVPSSSKSKSRVSFSDEKKVEKAESSNASSSDSSSSEEEGIPLKVQPTKPSTSTSTSSSSEDDSPITDSKLTKTSLPIEGDKEEEELSAKNFKIKNEINFNNFKVKISRRNSRR
uniref:Histone deacetylase interacting domain-containing protein n=1 Tax=Panagrolaimus superbus TaxID=310955 RepID=A0A914YWU4_9BILA